MEVKRALTQVFQWHRGHGEGDAASALGTGGQNDRWQTGASKIEAEERDRKEVCVCGREWWVNGAASARRLSVVVSGESSGSCGGRLPGARTGAAGRDRQACLVQGLPRVGLLACCTCHM